MSDRIRQEQQRIDELDSSLDQKIDSVKENVDYSEIVYSQLDEVLNYMQVLDQPQQAILEQELLSILVAIDSENIDYLVGELQDKTSDWLSVIDAHVETDTSFLDNHFKFGLGLSAKRDYAMIMRQNNVDAGFVADSLDVYDELTFGLEGQIDPNLKLQVLSDLVSGIWDRFIPGEFLDYIFEITQAKISSSQETMNVYEEQKQYIERNISQSTNTLIQLSEKNNEWFSFMDDEVDSEVANLQRQYENLAQINGQIDALDSSIDQSVSSMLLARFLILKSNSTSDRNSDLVDFALRAKMLAPDNLPETIDDFIANHVDLEQTDLSEFYQSLILDNFEQAREILEQNISEVVSIGVNNDYSLPDLFRTYRDIYSSQSKTASDERYLLSSVEAGFGQDTDARRLLDEGYKLVQLTDHDVLGQPGFEGGAHRMFMHNLFLVKQMSDGSFNYVSISSNGSINPDNPEVLNVSGQQEQQMVQAQRENHENLQLLMERNPEITEFRDSVSLVSSKLNNLRTLLSGLMRGEKTQAAVDLVRTRASELQQLMVDVDLEAKRDSVMGQLGGLIILAQEGVDSEVQENIQRVQVATKQMYDSLNSQDLNRMFERIQSQDFSVDNFFLQTVLPTLGAIGTAVGAVMWAFPTGGASLIALGAVGSLGGMVGHEFTTAGVELTTNVETRTMLGSALMGSRVFNAETGEYESVQAGQLFANYGEQFVMGTIQTASLMGIGRAVGGILTKFAQNNSLAPGVRGFFARGLQKIPRIGRTDTELLKANGASGFMSRFVREFGEELTEEAIETGAYQVHPAFGTLASILVCTRINNVSQTMAGHAVVSSGVSIDGNTIESNFTYDANSQETILSDVRRKFPEMSASIDQESGVVSVERSQTVNNQDFVVRMQFKPSPLPSFARKLQSGNVSGQNAGVEQIYDISLTADAIVYGSEGGGNVMSLKSYIESQGGLVIENEDGSSKVRFGNLEYDLVSQSQLQEQAQSGAQAESEAQAESQAQSDAGLNAFLLDTVDTPEIQLFDSNFKVTESDAVNLLDVVDASQMGDFVTEVLNSASNINFEGKVLCFDYQGESYRIGLETYLVDSKDVLQSQIVNFSNQELTQLFHSKSPMNSFPTELSVMALYIQNNNPILAHELTNLPTVQLLRSVSVSDQNYASNVLELTIAERGANASKNIGGRPIFAYKHLGGGGFGAVNLSLYFDSTTSTWTRAALKTAQNSGGLIKDIRECERFFDSSDQSAIDMQNQLRAMRGLNQPIHIDAQQEFILMETFDGMSDLNPYLQGVSYSERASVAAEYMDSMGSVLETMEQMWSLGLFHGDLKPGNAMVYRDSNGDRQTLVIDIAPHETFLHQPYVGPHTPHFAIWTDAASLNPVTRQAARSRYHADRDYDAIRSSAFYAFARGFTVDQSERYALGFDLRSLSLMVGEHIDSNPDLYSQEQIAEWNYISIMSENMEAAHSIEYLIRFRNFVSNVTGKTLPPISREISRRLPSVSYADPVMPNGVAVPFLNSQANPTVVNPGLKVPQTYRVPVQPPTVVNPGLVGKTRRVNPPAANQAPTRKVSPSPDDTFIDQNGDQIPQNPEADAS